MIPKGTLIIIGGAEDKGNHGVDIADKNATYRLQEILSLLIPENKRRRAHRCVEIITTASSAPLEVNQMYKDAFTNLKHKNIGFINMDDNPDTCNPHFIDRINKAHSVLFSGGGQCRLSTILRNTDVLDAAVTRYINGPDLIVAGTIAGAMAIPNLMMVEGSGYAPRERKFIPSKEDLKEEDHINAIKDSAISYGNKTRTAARKRIAHRVRK